MYFFYEYMTGLPFEFEAADSQAYHSLGSMVADMIHNGNLDNFYKQIGANYSDMGYPLYLGIFYSFFGKSILLVRIFKSFLGAYTCVLIYKLATRSFNESTGRIAAILAMLSPTLIYYCGMHLKETEMVFLIVLALERADYALRYKNISFQALFITSLAALSLFFFRTVLAASVIFSLITVVVFSPKKVVNISKKVLFYFWGGIIVFLMLGSVIQKNIDNYLEMSDQNQKIGLDFRTNRKDGNKLAKYGSFAIFAPILLVGPLPTLVNIDTQQNQMLLNGSYFVRNILAFFFFLSLFVLHKQKKLGESSLLISFIFSYLAIIGLSTFALSERFHLPVVPFIIILASYGMTQLKPIHKKRFSIYIIFLSVLIVGWNWFKLAGRA